MTSRLPLKNQGFTLLEVMIALAIVGIALVVMLGLAQRSVLVNSRLQQMTRATLLAKQKMAEIEHGLNLGSDQTKGIFAEPNQGFSWRRINTPTPIIGIVQVDLSVLWGKEEENDQVTLTSFIKE
ncbi:type IV pilus modification PilV family protein [Geopsychrobacter electrodiphilus]|uniref:type IV pilus modification PilV family protein n=1 Tax=Geopsychrobacter electrodiphilus TaxID=225196 RepID=UPI000370226F|nr:prepilin-type N-terminal cleavage/methylation domain-containing protein [Geopsychrobacter electrodiphilus]